MVPGAFQNCVMIATLSPPQTTGLANVPSVKPGILQTRTMFKTGLPHQMLYSTAPQTEVIL